MVFLLEHSPFCTHDLWSPTTVITVLIRCLVKLFFRLLGLTGQSALKRVLVVSILQFQNDEGQEPAAEVLL